MEHPCWYIQSSVSKHLNILRRLKYRLSRTNLDKLYLLYIRPLFEYACELWDNCGIRISQKLEQLQQVFMRSSNWHWFSIERESRFSGMLRLENNHDFCFVRIKWHKPLFFYHRSISLKSWSITFFSCIVFWFE
jgi:hypothetical protein